MQSGVHFYAIVCDLSVESFDWCWSWCAVPVHVPVFVNLLSIIVVIRLCYGDICFVVLAIILCTLSARWCTCKNCLLSTTDWHTKLQGSACSSWLNSTTDNSLQEMDQPFYANGCAWWSWCVLLSAHLIRQILAVVALRTAVRRPTMADIVIFLLGCFHGQSISHNCHWR